MPKKSFLFVILLLTISLSGQYFDSEMLKKNDIVSNFMNLSPRQLFDTAKYYQDKNLMDTALILYNILINTPVLEVDSEQQKALILALNNSAVIYYNLYDYKTSYKFLIRALQICENKTETLNLSEIYNNMGIIFHRFKNFEATDMYYSKALDICTDSLTIIGILNNLGFIKLEKNKPDSAFIFLNEALKLSGRYNNLHSYAILNNIAMFYRKQNCYDSAYYYYRLSLEDVMKNNNVEWKALTLLNLGNMFFEIKNTDSASYYFDLSKSIATENKFLKILEEIYFNLSKIEETKGNSKNAFEYIKKYNSIRDSLFNIEIFNEINQMQRLYEVSKTNQQIENLIIDLKIKEQTIYHQKVIRRIIIYAFVFICCIFTYILLLHKKLRKYRKNVLSRDVKAELIKRILTVMENTTIICDPKFTVNNLAELVNSNQLYVSQIINNEFKKNFRSFLNSYRIKEAQRIFSLPGSEKFTIEHVASKVGYKSRTTFREAFKEITGISPHLYLKEEKLKSKKQA